MRSTTRCSRRILFRPGLWLVLADRGRGLCLAGEGDPAGAFAVAVTASAIVYVMTFFVVGVAADFRYAYWCVLATLAGAVAAVLARDELRSGLTDVTRAGSPVTG